LSNYDSGQIKNSLMALGVAGLDKMNGTLSVSTDAFSLQMSKVGDGAAALDAAGVGIEMPPVKDVFPGAKAVSLISWTDSLYSGNVTPDSPTISLSLLGPGGRELSVSNLSKPIMLNLGLSVAADDRRFVPVPSYLVKCDTGVMFVTEGLGYAKFTNYTLVEPGTWRVPCMMDTFREMKCAGSGVGTVQTLTCETPVYTPRCLYWDTAAGGWSSDGCVAVGNLSQITCMCTHLTDFSARMDAVVAGNAAIFANAGNVYSLAGLAKYAQWYGIFGGIALVTLILGVAVTRVDQLATQRFVGAVCANKYIAEILALSQNVPIYIYDGLSTIREHKGDRLFTARTPEKKLNMCHRICLQHSRLQFMFRYDPRLSRIFRLLTLFLIQFNSLFVTAFFYGFTYGVGTPMMWYDTVLLALLTSGVNMPVVRIIFWAMNTIGMEEFIYQFPLLYYEYHRRAEFEKMALVYFKDDFEKHKLALEQENAITLRNVVEGEKAGGGGAGSDDEGTGKDDVQESLMDILFFYFCCRKSQKNKEEEDLAALPRAKLLKRMANVIKESHPYIEASITNWGWLPCQTWKGVAFLLGSCGWIGWCLNYLLLFAAGHDTSVGSTILTSYATSELTTVFLSQPLIICVTVGLYMFLSKYGSRLPQFLQKILMVGSIRSIPSLFYYSDPWSANAKTAFTSEFAYNIFVKSAAAASGSNEQAYAPMKALVAEPTLDENEAYKVEKINGLYIKMAGVWHDLQSKRGH